MEPFDPVRNEESSGYTKRRTSILKLPRKSTAFSEVVEKVNVVECPKPSEKRISRRVSFAPANDVLLFSKDSKNPTPSQGPLQDGFFASSATQNRVQMNMTEDQQFMGVSALLKAPKQILQQKDTAGIYSERNYGEKTMIFPADDLDMTQCHTVRITNEEAFLDTSHGLLHGRGERTVMFDRSMDLTLSQTLNIISDQDVSFSSKSTSPGRFPFTAPMTPGTQFFFDKENLVPKMNRSIIKKMGDPNVRSFSPEDDMDMTETNPLRCLFPQEIYMEDDKGKSQTFLTDKKCTTTEPTIDKYSKRRSTVNFDTKVTGRSEKVIVFSHGMETTLKTNVPSHQMVIASEDESREKTVRFSADDACMDETRSYTVKISSDLQLQPDVESLSGEKTVRFTANDAGMDMTQCLTVNIARDLVPNSTTEPKQQSVGSLPVQSFDLEFENFFASLSGQNPKEKTTQMNYMKPFTKTQSHTETMSFTKDSRMTGAADGGGGKYEDDNTVNMDITEAHTGGICGDENIYQKAVQTGQTSQLQRSVLRTLPVKGAEHFPKSQIQSYSVDFDEEPVRERTVRFAADEALMDETRCHTVNIVKDFVPSLHQDLELLPKYGEKTVRFDADDATMDMTRSQTVKIDLPNESFNSLPKQGEKTERFNAAMDETKCHTVNILKDFVPSLHEDLRLLPKYGEKTVRFDADDATMDMTRSQTVKIDLPNESFNSLPKQGEKTERFNAAMDETKCHTVNILKDFVPSLHEDLRLLPKYGEKTVRFDADDATMDMTRSQTVKIDLPNESLSSLPKQGEKTERFDAAMDETKCLTVNIVKDFVPSSREDLELLPKYGEKTVRFNADDATMDMTRSQTVKIDLPNDSFSSLPKQGEKTERFNAAMDETQCLTVNIATEMRPKLCLAVTQNCTVDPEPQVDGNTSSGENKLRFSVDDPDVTKSYAMTMNAEPRVNQGWDALPRSEDKTLQFISDEGGMEVTQCLTGNICVEDEESHSYLSPGPTNVTADGPPALKKRGPIIYTNRRCQSVGRNDLNAALKARRSVPWGNSLTRGIPTPITDDSGKTTETAVVNENRGTLSIIEEKSIAEVSLKEKGVDKSLDMNMTEAIPVQMQRMSILELPVKDLTTEDAKAECEVEINLHPGSPQTNTTKFDVRDDVEKPERLPASVEKVGKAVNSRKSRRMSLAEIHSKMRCFSETLSAPDDTAAVDVNVPTPSPVKEPKCEVVKPELLQTNEPDVSVDLEKNEYKSDAANEPFCAPTTPFKLETKQLMSRLSVVGFRPKLTKTSKREQTKTLDVTKSLDVQVQNQAGSFDLNVSDINDEELESYEDVSETLDAQSLDKGSEMVTSFELDQELQDEVFEEFAHVNKKKRPLEEENAAEDEKRMRTSNDTAVLDSQTCTLECDGNITTTANTQNTNSTNCSQTASLRCEAMFESASTQSLFESSLEDYANDIQKKYEEGSLTMMEFFKLFHIDFVIHNPRQSVAPGRVLSDTESTLMDLSRDRHIGLPKQQVYEADVQNLTELVEGLKVRMRDLDKPLTLVNKTLWEEMEHFSEAELKSLGAKLKERHNLYRKKSKAKSHEMKEGLYTELIQANAEEQKKLRGSIEKADTMLASLDDTIAELEAELAAIEDCATSHQEELSKITEATSNNERATLELELQMKQSLNKMGRVKEETKALERHLNMLHTINEWRMEEITTSHVIYAFLYKTLHMELVYEESEGNNGERKILGISFKHSLDEKSECHARLVHTLISQFTQDERLTTKYPTSKHVPELLHDVSLVVSRSRQLGEELRKLKAWGSLRFNILDIHCLHSEIHITFSSLKTFKKFEMVLSVCLTNKLYELQLKSFKNIIGSTTFQNIEDIVASFSQGPKCLTKMIKNISSSLLC